MKKIIKRFSGLVKNPFSGFDRIIFKGCPLPRAVVYYDLPSAVVVKLGSPPKGHRYIHVATDILLMAIGTGMVVDQSRI